MPSVRTINSDVFQGLSQLPDESVHCCVTSPPYWHLRDYGVDGQIGLEPTIAEHVDVMVRVFREVRRVLRSDGTLWLNYGDMYAGSWGAQSRGYETAGTLQGSSMLDARRIAAHPARIETGSMKRFQGLKPKDLVMMPERIALALQADGWWVRDRIIWHKPNPMPSSVKDRCTPSYEIVWHLAKSERYYHDGVSIAEPRVQDEDANGFRGGSYTGGKPGGRSTKGNRRLTDPRSVPPGAAQHRGLGGKNEDTPDRTQSGFNGRSDEAEARGADGWTRNRRNVWTIATEPYKGGHFATMPTELARLCILAGCPLGGTVVDPFGGAGTVGMVADRNGRNAILIEINPAYVADHITPRIKEDRGVLLDMMSME